MRSLPPFFGYDRWSEPVGESEQKVFGAGPLGTVLVAPTSPLVAETARHPPLTQVIVLEEVDPVAEAIVVGAAGEYDTP